MPANRDNYILDGLLDYGALALGQRRMLDERKLDKRIFLAPRPIAKELLCHLKNLFGLNVSSHNQSGVIWYVIASLNQAHLLGCRRRNSLPISQGRLAARIFVKESRKDLAVQVIERIRFVSIDLTNNHFALALKLEIVEQRVTGRISHELHRGSQIRTGRREVIVNYFFASGTVIGNSQLADCTHVIFRVGDRAIGFEEHVLVQVGKSVEFRRFGIRSVLNTKLDGDERYRMILNHDHFEPVWQDLVGELGI